MSCKVASLDHICLRVVEIIWQVNEEKNGRVQVEVYRKPTHTDKYLDFGSHHPIKQKQSVANTL